MEALLVAFVLGTAVSAVSGTFSETIFGGRARLEHPFVDQNRILVSLTRLLFAGAYFLVGEAAEARGEGRCSTFVWYAAIFFAAIWCLSLGIVGLELTSQLFSFSMSAMNAGERIYEPI